MEKGKSLGKHERLFIEAEEQFGPTIKYFSDPGSRKAKNPATKKEVEKGKSLHDHGMAFVEAMEQINRKITYFTEIELRKASGTIDRQKARKMAIDDVLGLARGDEGFQKEPVQMARLKGLAQTVRDALNAAHHAKLSGLPLDEEPVWSMITDTYFGMLPSQDRDPVRLAICFEALDTKKVREALSDRQKNLIADRSNRESTESFQKTMPKSEPWKPLGGQKCGPTCG